MVVCKLHSKSEKGKGKCDIHEAKVKIGIAIPVLNAIPAQSFSSILDVLGYTADRYETTYAIKVNTLIDLARNELAKVLLKNGCTHIWFIDSDMVLPKNAIDYLMNGLKYGDACSGLYFSKERKNGRYIPMAAVESQIGEYLFVEKWPKDAMAPIDAVGFGCILLKREVFERIEYPWFELQWRKKVVGDDEEWYEIGEDIGFCEKMKKAGMKIILHTGIKLGHVGSVIDQDVVEAFSSYGYVKAEVKV